DAIEEMLARQRLHAGNGLRRKIRPQFDNDPPIGQVHVESVLGLEGLSAAGACEASGKCRRSDGFLQFSRSIASRRLLSSLSRNWLVVSQVCCGLMRRARSLVMKPASTVSTHTRSNVSANRCTSAVPSNLPRYQSPRVQA